MTAIKLSIVAAASLVAIAMTASTAAASTAPASPVNGGLDLGNILVAACGSGGDRDAAIEELAELCKIKPEGDVDKQACDKVDSKDVLDCRELSAESAGDLAIQCKKDNVTFEITLTMNLPSGYGISGTFNLQLEINASVTNVEKCKKGKKNNVTAKGGHFVSMTGDATFSFVFTGTGTATVTFPTGSFTMSATASCNNLTTIPIYRVGEMFSCKKSRNACAYDVSEGGEYGEYGDECDETEYSTETEISNPLH